MSFPPMKREWNINTFIVLGGFLAMAVGWGMTWGSTANDVTTLLEFKRAAEGELRRIDSLAFRVAASERANETVSRVLEDLKTAVAQQSGDIRVVREILQRIERQGRASSLSSYPLAIADQDDQPQ